jgi:hypothetical protein
LEVVRRGFILSRPIDNIGRSVKSVGGEETETIEGRTSPCVGGGNDTTVGNARSASCDGSDDRKKTARAIKVRGINDRTHT